MYLCSYHGPRVCCVRIGLKILRKTSFHIFAHSQPPKNHKHCQTGFFKKKIRFKFSKYFLCQTLNNVHRSNCFSNMQCLWCVSPSHLLTTLSGKCVRWEALWVVRAGWCIFVWSLATCLFSPTHTTQCAIMLLALCGDLQYRCVTDPVWDCLFFFHI